MRIIVILLLVLIIASMGSALYYLLTDKPGSQRTAKALTTRVGLSVLLFVLLMIGYYFGLIGK